MGIKENRLENEISKWQKSLEKSNLKTSSDKAVVITISFDSLICDS
jgi:hypothetical protein